MNRITRPINIILKIDKKCTELISEFKAHIMYQKVYSRNQNLSEKKQQEQPKSISVSPEIKIPERCHGRECEIRRRLLSERPEQASLR